MAKISKTLNVSGHQNRSGKLTIPLLISLAVCVIGQAANADTSIYVFDPNQSTIVRSGGIAGLQKTLSVAGRFQLTVDLDAGFASFDKVDADLTDETGSVYGQNLDEIFNMTGLAGTVINDTTIDFEGKTADGTESDVSLKLTLSNDSAHLTGKTTPPPNSADMFFYDIDGDAVATKKYAGGTGEPNDPYQIATASDLIALGETPEDYDKHFILTADIDLDPNLPGRKVFDKAVIAPGQYGLSPGGPMLWGIPFVGVFDGNGHTISHLTIEGEGCLGLFGRLDPGADVKDLGVLDVNISGLGECVGGLVGDNCGALANCCSTGTVHGLSSVGGLVGMNGFVTMDWDLPGSVANCYSGCIVRGGSRVGGLAGFNCGDVTCCYSTGTVTGDGNEIGGLVGLAFGSESAIITDCYSWGSVSGNEHIGGLVGHNYWCTISSCYSTGTVAGNSYVGGLVGEGVVGEGDANSVVASFWDTETSGQATSAGGRGKSTGEMQTAKTFLDASWDFVGQRDGPHDIWAEPQGGGYPVLCWQLPSGFGLPDFSVGSGQADDPYIISRPDELNSIGHNPRLMRCHFKLADDLDLTGFAFHPIGGNIGYRLFPTHSFRGAFDGNGHTISHLTIRSGAFYMGLFGGLGRGAQVKNLGVVDVNITGSALFVGGLVGENRYGTVTRCYSTGVVGGNRYVGGLVGSNAQGTVTECYSTGAVSAGAAWGKDYVGGLVGENGGNVTGCHSAGTVTGRSSVGGLVGSNAKGSVSQCYNTAVVTGSEDYVGGLVGENSSTVTQCYSTGMVSGDAGVGGLVGENRGTVTQCYSAGNVTGRSSVGGLVAWNDEGSVSRCYSTGAVSGGRLVGGLIGWDYNGTVTACRWDIQTSGQATSDGGVGKTTAEMWMVKTFLDAGWDFVGETANGTEDIWWILEGKDYPRLWWQLPADDFEDGEPEPLWFVYEVDPDLVQIREVNGRLETLASAQAQNVDAFYVSDGWRLDVTKEFAIRVDFHFSKQGGGDGRVTLGVIPSLDPSAMQWAELEAGCFDTGPFYLYEVRDRNWVQERVADRFSDGGTLYMSFNPDTDELYFSHSGYGKANAWQTVTGLLKGRWASEPVYVILGGGSDQVILDAGDAYLDNFVVDSGLLDFSATPDDTGTEEP